MFGHVKFGVSDFAASKAFFLKHWSPLAWLSQPKASRQQVDAFA